MIFPYLIFAIGLLAVLAYFARKNVTWTVKKGTSGSLGMAIIVFCIVALIAWGIDALLDWSVVPHYCLCAGGALQIIAIMFFLFYGLLCLSMLSSAAKVGQMVA